MLHVRYNKKFSASALHPFWPTWNIFERWYFERSTMNSWCQMYTYTHASTDRKMSHFSLTWYKFHSFKFLFFDKYNFFNTLSYNIYLCVVVKGLQHYPLNCNSSLDILQALCFTTWTLLFLLSPISMCPCWSVVTPDGSLNFPWDVPYSPNSNRTSPQLSDM